jgi:hypothetical protein
LLLVFFVPVFYAILIALSLTHLALAASSRDSYMKIEMNAKMMLINGMRKGSSALISHTKDDLYLGL